MKPPRENQDIIAKTLFDDEKEYRGQYWNGTFYLRDHDCLYVLTKVKSWRYA